MTAFKVRENIEFYSILYAWINIIIIGLGSTGPNFEQSLVLPNGVTVPVGSLEDKKAKIAEQQQEAKKKRDAKKAAKINDKNKNKDDEDEDEDEDADSDAEEKEEKDDDEKSENDEDADLINANLYYLREFNEYIVYDTSQVRMRYLIQLKRK